MNSFPVHNTPAPDFTPPKYHSRWKCGYEIHRQIALGIAITWNVDLDMHIAIGPFVFGIWKEYD